MDDLLKPKVINGLPKSDHDLPLIETLNETMMKDLIDMLRDKATEYGELEFVFPYSIEINEDKVTVMGLLKPKIK